MDDLQDAKVVLGVGVLLSAFMHSACLRNRPAAGLDEVRGPTSQSRYNQTQKVDISSNWPPG